MITLELIRDVVEDFFDLNLENTNRGGLNSSAKYCYYNLAFRFCKNKSAAKISGVLGQDHATALHYRDKRKPKENDDKFLFKLTKQLDSYLAGSLAQRDLTSISKSELQKSLSLQIEENQRLLIKIKHMEKTHEQEIVRMKTKGINGMQHKLNTIFIQLPERIQKDLLFKAKTALKLNPKSA